MTGEQHDSPVGDNDVVAPRLDPDAWAASEGIEDPDILAEIDAEFAALNDEIQRIATLSHNDVEDRVTKLLQMRQQRLETMERLEDMPPWKRRLHVAFDEALKHIINEAIQRDGSGQVQFSLNSESLQRHGKPLLEAFKASAPDLLAAAIDGILNPKTADEPKPQSRAARRRAARRAKQAGQQQRGAAITSPAPPAEPAAEPTTASTNEEAVTNTAAAVTKKPVHVDEDGKLHVTATSPTQASGINVKIDVNRFLSALLEGGTKKKT